MKEPLRVYIAGPLTEGPTHQHIQDAIAAADILVTKGYLPFVPHLSFLWALIYPHSHDWWLEYDKGWLLQCNAVLRLPGTSVGANKEVNLARSRGIPVVYSLEELEQLRCSQ